MQRTELVNAKQDGTPLQKEAAYGHVTSVQSPDETRASHVLAGCPSGRGVGYLLSDVMSNENAA